MADIYKLQYMNNTLTYPGWNGYVQYEDAPSYYTLTLQTDGHGTLIATTLTGYPGDTITLSPTYNTYYRFNNYSVTGGTIAGNTFTFGSEDATAQANFKVNYFTATGKFEKGSDIVNTTQGNNMVTKNVAEKYALHVNHTGDISTSWYANSNKWQPANASAYSITLNTKMTFVYGTQNTTNTLVGAVTAVSLIGSTQTASQSFSKTNGWATGNYNKTITTTTQTTYGVSAKLNARGKTGTFANYSGYAKYVANGTTGTWTATGIAP